MHCTINRKYLRYFERNPRNIVNICANIYDDFNGKNRGLLPPGEDLVFYYKMKVDFHRYLAEFAEDRTEDVNESLVAYNKAFDIAKKGSSPHTSNQAGACSELFCFPLSNPFLSSWSVQTGQGSICGRHRRVWHNVRGVVQGQHSHHAGAAKQPSPLVINQIEKEGEEKPIKGWEWAKKENVKNAASISWSDFGSNQLQLCVIINLLGVFVGILYSLISDIFHIFQHNFSSMT